MGSISFKRMIHAIAILSLGLGVLCFLIVVGDISAGNRQHMWIMNVVWPVTMLYSGPLGLWLYFTAGRNGSEEKPFWQSVALATTHCGSGCTLGDISAEWIMVVVPFALFGQKLFGGWVLDYILAFGFGVGFQYFTIRPMKDVTWKEGIKAAVKADTLSLTAWQVGMYGWMAIATFVLFHRDLPKTDPVFWFMMQIAMVMGFATSCPVNMYLVRTGLKEKM